MNQQVVIIRINNYFDVKPKEVLASLLKQLDSMNLVLDQAPETLAYKIKQNSLNSTVTDLMFYCHVKPKLVQPVDLPTHLL